MNKKGEIQVSDIRYLQVGDKIEARANDDLASMRCSILDKRNPGFSVQCSYCDNEVVMHAWGLMSRGARCKNCKALYWNGFWWRFKKEE